MESVVLFYTFSLLYQLCVCVFFKVSPMEDELSRPLHPGYRNHLEEEPGKTVETESLSVSVKSIFLKLGQFMGFPGASDSKESTRNAGEMGDLASVPGWGRCPGEGTGYPLQYSCLESPHGQRSLVGYSPWGRTESDTTERLSTAQHTHSSTLAWRSPCSLYYCRQTKVTRVSSF